MGVIFYVSEWLVKAKNSNGETGSEPAAVAQARDAAFVTIIALYLCDLKKKTITSLPDYEF